MAAGLAIDLKDKAANGSPRLLATLVQALLHGLSMQRAADPDAFDPEEMLNLCLDLLSSYLGLSGLSARPRKVSRSKKTASLNGTHKPARRVVNSKG